MNLDKNILALQRSGNQKTTEDTLVSLVGTNHLNVVKKEVIWYNFAGLSRASPLNNNA